VQRIPLIRREIREFLGSSALELLFSQAEAVVEGGCDDGHVYATVMVTLDLDRLSRIFREPMDEATAARVAELMEGHPWVRDHLARLAAPELAELAGHPAPPKRVQLEHQIRVEGRQILIDGDAMAPLSSRARGER
jgi:hypothetical protein